MPCSTEPATRAGVWLSGRNKVSIMNQLQSLLCETPATTVSLYAKLSKDAANAPLQDARSSDAGLAAFRSTSCAPVTAVHKDSALKLVALLAAVARLARDRAPSRIATGCD